MIQDIYEQIMEFCDTIEQEYDGLFICKKEWEVFHASYLNYYLLRYNITDEKEFIIYHFRTAYRLFLGKLMTKRDLISF